MTDTPSASLLPSLATRRQFLQVAGVAALGPAALGAAGYDPERSAHRPQSDGRPDPPPNVREDVKILGNLTAGFDFNAKLRAPLLLPVHPATTAHRHAGLGS